MPIHDASRQSRYAGLIFTLLLSVLWTVCQMISHTSQFSYSPFSREFCSLLKLPVAGTEAQRMCSVLAYLTSLPHILLAYLLFTKFPPRKKSGFSLRCLAVVLVFAASVLVHPRFGASLIPALRSGISSPNPTAMTMMKICILLGLGGVLLYFAVTAIRRLRIGTLMPGRALRKYGCTLILAFLMAVLYGAVLGILGHFLPEAPKAVVRNFQPDASLYSGIFSMAVMAPLVEELGYRGMILAKLKNHMPVWAAVLISSALFAVWHRNPGQIVATFPMGILFACVYLRTGKLRFAMLVHSASNFLLTMSMASTASLVPYCKPLVQLRYSLLDISLGYGIALAALLIAAIAAILWKGYASTRRNDEYIKRA